MSTDAGGDAGGSNMRSRSDEETRAENAKSVLDRYQEALNARALHTEAERIQMLMSYADLKTQIDRISEVDVDRSKAALHVAKLRVMHASITSTLDLAVKVLVAAEDGFASKDVNALLEQDAQRIVAAAP